jgi:hypothetical protein
MEYTFTLKYQIAERGADLDALVERLGAAGCDDALLGLGQAGRLALRFEREAESARLAIRSALADVKRASPGARLIEAAPDFVGLTDVAEIVGVSRQNMRQLMLAHIVSFPAPVHEGSSSIWHLAQVLGWLERQGGYEVERAIVETSEATFEVNLAKAARQLPSQAAQELERLVA